MQTNNSFVSLFFVVVVVVVILLSFASFFLSVSARFKRFVLENHLTFGTRTLCVSIHCTDRQHTAAAAAAARAVSLKLSFSFLCRYHKH